MSDTLPSRNVNPIVVGLSIALAAALIALAVVWINSSKQRGLDAAEDGALEAARSSAVSMTSYDYRQLDKDYAWVNDGATPGFAKQYKDANKPLRGIVEKLQATARGTVSESAATATSTSRVNVLLFIDQKIVNKANKENRSDRSRVIMKMVKRDGEWLVDDVQLR